MGSGNAHVYGRYLLNALPLITSKEEKGEWVIDEEAAAVVRRIFQSVLAGETVRRAPPSGRTPLTA